MSAAGDLPVMLVTGIAGELGTVLARRAGRARIAGTWHKRPPQIDTQLGTALDPEVGDDRAGEPAFAIQADLSSPRDCERVVELTLARFGRIDHLVNNAADTRFLGSTVEAWGHEADILRQLRLNLIAPMRLASLVARDFWRDRPEENRRWGRSVVNVSSISGTQIFAGHGQAVYGTSKSALNFLTLHMCEEYDAIGVRVNAIAPGGFPKQIPTEDVADTVLRLIFDSDATGMIA